MRRSIALMLLLAFNQPTLAWSIGIPRQMADELGSTYHLAWWEPIVWFGGFVGLVFVAFVGWLLWQGLRAKSDQAKSWRPPIEGD
jgi:hypothetical protein